MTRSFSSSHTSELDDDAPRRLGHHDHPLGLVAERSEDLQLVLGRIREHGVQRHDERLRELSRKREGVGPVPAAEDAVLVLEQDDVDVEASERARGAHIVSARALRDGLEDLRALRARRIVDDDEGAAILDIGDAEQRRSYVERKGSDPARTRRVRREDRGTHGCRAAPFASSLPLDARCAGVPSANSIGSGPP